MGKGFYIVVPVSMNGTFSVTHPLSYQVGTPGFSSLVKRPERKAANSCASGGEVKNAWSSSSIPRTTSERIVQWGSGTTSLLLGII